MLSLPARVDQNAILDAPKWLSVRQAADILRLKPSSIRDQISAGKMRAERRDGRWCIAKAALIEYAETRLKRRRHSAWSKEQLAELKLTGECKGRTRGASRLKRWREAKKPCNGRIPALI